MATISLVGIASNDKVQGLCTLHALIEHDSDTFQWIDSVVLKGQSPQAYLEANLTYFVAQIDAAKISTVLHPEVIDPMTGLPTPESNQPLTLEEKIEAACALNESKRSTRVLRNTSLTSCDWTQLSDSPLDSSAKTAWVTYRQDLRDVPEQVGFPDGVEWPTEP